MRILNFGSLNIDYVYKLDHFVCRGETILSKSLHIYPGGKGLNQSIALRRAGLEIYQAGCIGADGNFLLDVLKNSDIDINNITILKNKRTGNAIIQNEKSGDNCIILYGGANQLITKKQVDKVLLGFKKGDYLVLQNEINQMEYIIDSAYKIGMTIALNPSPMNEKIKKLDLQKIDIFILNEIEAGQILNTNSKDENILLNGLLEKFPNAKIVLTLGGNGSCYIDKIHRIRQDIYKVDVVDTTAAGDTFCGYFLAELAKNKSIKKSMEFAAKAAAIAVTKSGASPSIPTYQEVENYKF